MPSYIEIKKQATFPPSSSSDKMIFGVKSNDKAALTDHLGNTVEIGGGGGGGTGCNVTPCNDDYVGIQSYSRWIFGNQTFGPPTGNKFDVIAAENDNTDFLTLELIGGSINGCPISSCPLQSITVDYTNLVYRDDGFGLYPANYIDFINSIFSANSLYTTFSGTSELDPGDYRIKSNYCKVDNFSLIFSDFGQIDGSPLNRAYFYFSGKNGLFIADTVASDYSILSYNVNQGINSWTQYI